MDTITAREPRSRLIGRFIEHWLNGVTEKQEAYADDVRQRYFLHYPDPEDRAIKFHSTDDAAHDLKENRRIVMRRLRGEIKLEADFEEAAIDALTADVRAELLQQLCARYGLLAVPFPQNTPHGAAADLSRLAEEFGEAVQAVADLLEGDGEINEHDSTERLHVALNEIDDVISAATVFRESIQDALLLQEVDHA